MKIFYYILALVGGGILALILAIATVVFIVVIGGWLAAFVAPFGNREKRAAEQLVKTGRLARQGKM